MRRNLPSCASSSIGNVGTTDGVNAIGVERDHVLDGINHPAVAATMPHFPQFSRPHGATSRGNPLMRSTAGVVSRIQVLHTHIGTRKIVDQRHAALFHEHRVVRLGNRSPANATCTRSAARPGAIGNPGLTSNSAVIVPRPSTSRGKIEPTVSAFCVKNPKHGGACSYFSRKPHVPSPSAGITRRGDLKAEPAMRSCARVVRWN